MKGIKRVLRKIIGRKKDDRGSALIVVTLLLALLTVYVSASLSIATTDVISSNFEVAQQRGFFTAYSKLEQMSRDFSGLFVSSPLPGYDSMCQIVLADPSLINGFRIVKPPVTCPPGSPCTPSYTAPFLKGTDLFDLGWVGDTTPFCMIDVCNPGSPLTCNFPRRPPKLIQVTKGDFAGLQGFARRYRQVSTAVSENRGGADVQLVRDFDNILLPLFQFGIFTDSDFELYDPPNWAFGGWVHTNGDFYLMGGASGLAGVPKGTPRSTFSQYILDNNNKLQPTAARITVAKHMLIGDEKNGDSEAGSYMWVYNGPNTYDIVDTGSAKGGAFVTGNCNGITDPSQDVKTGNCASISGTSAQTIKIGVRPLKLPIQTILGASPIELIKRGMSADLNPALGSPYYDARYFYKPGIRITLADYQNQLPRQVKDKEARSAGSGEYGGIQLDGADPWLADNVGTGQQLGKPAGPGGLPAWYYQQDSSSGSAKSEPIPRGYQPKIADPSSGRPTGARINGNRVHGWIKVELVNADGRTFDITQEFLNLGVTVPYYSNAGAGFYYPRSSAGLPASFPFPTTGSGPYPDENSIIHLQRFGVPFTGSVPAGLTGLTSPAGGLNPNLDDVSAGGKGLRFDYYASMALRNFNNSSLSMFGIADDLDKNNKYQTRAMAVGGNDTFPYAEPQPDAGGYYTDETRAPVPSKNLTPSQIDFAGTGTNTRKNGARSENANLPKMKGIVTATNDPNGVNYDLGETTWYINNRSLVPFPINMFDSREGTPHEPGTGGPANKPVPGLQIDQVSKTGVMNIMEIDMGNLGRLLKGDFDGLFSTMGSTPFTKDFGRALKATDILDNINVNQDNGWLVYVSDRRGDEPVVNTNPNIKLPASAPAPLTTKPAPGNALVSTMLGDGEYNREDVVWNPGGNTSTGSSDAVQVKFGGISGCTNNSTLDSDKKDDGKSPQDANNDCFIQRETAGNYSETADYASGFTGDQADPTSLAYSDMAGTNKLGNMIAMTQMSTNIKPDWSLKPGVMVPSAGKPYIETFRRAVRLVNASNLFPTGPKPSPCGALLGTSVISENPVYVLGNYNTPAAEVGDTTDAFPGLTATPKVTNPTSPGAYNGQDMDTCASNCHVPAAIVADAITLLSSPCVGTSNTVWSGAGGFAGWMDSRSFLTPYQSLGYRSARNTVYRFALISGFTPSWFPGFWGQNNTNQGPQSSYSSGALNNFPRFLEDWGQNNNSGQFATYAGSLIRIFKSRQGNGSFKRLSDQLAAPGQVDYVYRPPNRDWVFDVDFTNPCTLPPGSPFLQLIDFKGFQQSIVQR